MNKVIKRKLISSIVCIVVGIIMWIFPIIKDTMFTDNEHAYLNGFACGLFTVGIYYLITTVIAINNPDKAKKLENEVNDERLINNNNYAMAITYRVCIIVEAIVSIVCALLKHAEISKYIGFGIIIQLIIYLIAYFVVTKKN